MNRSDNSSSNLQTDDNDISLARSTGRGALWQIFGGGWQTFIRFSARIFLARALKPTDFGLFGMAILFNELLKQLGNVNMGTGIIAKKETSDDDLYTCFWSIALMRILMFVIAFSSAPLVANFFNDPRVTLIVKVISFTFIISIFSAVSQTILIKELHFRSLNIIKGSASLLESFLAVILALFTNIGYWALVIAMMSNQIVLHIAIFVAAKWKPRFRFNKESFRFLFRYGINTLGFSISNFSKENLDYLLVGKILGTQALGFYEFAYRIPHLLTSRIIAPVNAVAFPSFSKIQEDNERLGQGYIKIVKQMSLIAFPLLMGLAAVADTAVLTLWGKKWISIVEPLRILCFAAILQSIVRTIVPVFNAKHRPDLNFKIALGGFVWTGVIVYILGMLYGITGVATGVLLSLIANYIGLFIAFKLIKTKVRNLIKELTPILISAFICASFAYFTDYILKQTEMPHPVILLISVLIGAIVYFINIVFLFPHLAAETIAIGETVIGNNKIIVWFKKLVKI